MGDQRVRGDAGASLAVHDIKIQSLLSSKYTVATNHPYMLEVVEVTENAHKHEQRLVYLTKADNNA